ncbi:MIR domain-containing protein [Ditylenchus destructor]|uniref:MIR domain-containing protein n=1 Tax=Ditylenchus destructor TaxID=166010 RepID=A0AAD4MVY4_9BILA|nr:MIR domain-containing protein [Ditylenchus destructor]
MRIFFFLFCALLFLFTAKADDDPVTCTSIMKLLNVNEKVRLHSHDVKYGSGSGQQSITGMPDSGDVNSHWQILPAIGDECLRGEPIKCGTTIRFMHLTTRCFLHSHLFPAPLSRSHQEISCFGKEGEGSDTGDHYKVVCNGDLWNEDDEVRFKHVDTGMYLATSGQQYGRPISGQREVVGRSSSSGYDALWTTAEGIYIKSS